MDKSDNRTSRFTVCRWCNMFYEKENFPKKGKSESDFYYVKILASNFLTTFINPNYVFEIACKIWLVHGKEIFTVLQLKTVNSMWKCY